MPPFVEVLDKLLPAILGPLALAAIYGAIRTFLPTHRHKRDVDRINRLVETITIGHQATTTINENLSRIITREKINLSLVRQSALTISGENLVHIDKVRRDLHRERRASTGLPIDQWLYRRIDTVEATSAASQELAEARENHVRRAGMPSYRKQTAAACRIHVISLLALYNAPLIGHIIELTGGAKFIMTDLPVWFITTVVVGFIASAITGAVAFLAILGPRQLFDTDESTRSFLRRTLLAFGVSAAGMVAGAVTAGASLTIGLAITNIG